jgi:ComF family protein
MGGRTHTGCFTSQSLDGLTAIFSYQGIIKKAIMKLKYRFVSDLAGDLVEAFLSFCGEDKVFSRFCQKENPFFVPVPLHSRRKRWRGFNQAELLGKMIAANLGLTFEPNLLIRTKNTKPQTQLKDKESKRNILGAFKINPNCRLSIVNSKLVLFDDIWITGSTLQEGAKVAR